jgi:hypothetical protein
MPDNKYSAYAGTEPCFELVRKALGDLVDGEHFFECAGICGPLVVKCLGPCG